MPAASLRLTGWTPRWKSLCRERCSESGSRLPKRINYSAASRAQGREVLGLQAQHLRVPASIEGDAVVGQHQLAALKLSFVSQLEDIDLK
jgi:hypothetical protein